MDLSANWQVLLLSQITRGAFFMHPQYALGMSSHLQSILSLSPDKNKEHLSGLSLDLKRPDFIKMASSEGGDTYSIYDDAPQGSTAVFPIKGTMLKYGTWCDYGTQEIAGFMREAINHKNIESIILDIDSGGGSVSAIAPIVQVINEAKAANKPVVAKIDLCCSAAYYAAVNCNYIVADNNISAEIGSIGVMISFSDMMPYYEKMGVKFHKIYATQSDHKNQAFELALEGKYELIKAELLDPLAIGFQSHVKTQRKGKLDESIEGILSGKTYFADAALEYGMIDEIGTNATAIERAQVLAESRKFLANN